MRHLTLRWLLLAVLTAAVLPLARGRQPAPPPRPLPPSITGATASPTPPVSPASGTQAQPGTAAPIARFQNLQAFPRDTVLAVYGMRAGADWLWRMNQSNGRFLHGLNPALGTPLEGDHDLRQAHAAHALAEAARFTGDERFAARATQAVLTLLTLTKPDNAGSRAPAAPSEQCNKVGFAAVLALAIYALPNPDPKLLAQAEELCNFVRTRVGADGSVQTSDSATDPAKADPEGPTVYHGLAVQALAASNRIKPDAGKRDALTRAVKHYRAAFKARPHPMLAAALIPGFVDCWFQDQANAEARDAVFEMADWLCAAQYTQTDSRPGWVGGFKVASAEPGFETAVCAAALAAAVRLTRNAPDLARFPRYRQATLDALTFARGLQFSDENADHFERAFRTRFLVGGVHLGPSDGTVRIDATAQLVAAYLAFLQSGGEGRPE